MPNYTYFCCLCGLESVHSVKVDDRDKPGKACEICGHNQLVRTIEAPATSARFPGSHWDEYTKTGPRK